MKNRIIYIYIYTSTIVSIRPLGGALTLRAPQNKNESPYRGQTGKKKRNLSGVGPKLVRRLVAAAPTKGGGGSFFCRMCT